MGSTSMTSRERLLTAIRGGRPDHVPLVCRVFGFPAPPELQWEHGGRPVSFWYTMRLEHIHTLPQAWDLAQDFRRVQAWMSLGLDDVLEVSLPWSTDPRVTVRDYREETADGTVACREYMTPDGVLTHKVKLTRESLPPGWVVQPAAPPLFEDFNIPRAVRPPIVEPEDIAKVRHLLRPPTDDQMAEYRRRLRDIRAFAADRGVLVCGWSLFGMDAVVWLCGAEGAVLMAMTQPEVFAELVRLVEDFDRMRTEIMLEVGGIDLFVQRGWYSSVDFWSPDLVSQYLVPALRRSVQRVHDAGALFAYVMTTGVRPLLPMLADAGVDLWYWADPVQGDIDLASVREAVKGRMAVAGGVNAPLTLGRASDEEIRRCVREAIEVLGPAGFILEPVDSLFPDTPWSAVRTLIEEWKRTWKTRAAAS